MEYRANLRSGQALTAACDLLAKRVVIGTRYSLGVDSALLVSDIRMLCAETCGVLDHCGDLRKSKPERGSVWKRHEWSMRGFIGATFNIIQCHFVLLLNFPVCLVHTL